MEENKADRLERYKQVWKSFYRWEAKQKKNDPGYVTERELEQHKTWQEEVNTNTDKRD